MSKQLRHKARQSSPFLVGTSLPYHGLYYTHTTQTTQCSSSFASFILLSNNCANHAIINWTCTQQKQTINEAAKKLRQSSAIECACSLARARVKVQRELWPPFVLCGPLRSAAMSKLVGTFFYTSLSLPELERRRAGASKESRHSALGMLQLQCRLTVTTRISRSKAEARPINE